MHCRSSFEDWQQPETSRSPVISYCFTEVWGAAWYSMMTLAKSPGPTFWSHRTVSTDPLSEREALRLDQFLKLRGIADTGGQAKLLIQSGEVQVNGEVETRRRRKLVVGDVVEVEGRAYSPDEFLSGS